MSFSDQVRACIRETINDHDRRFACLYGMLLYGRTVTRTEIVLKSESDIFDSVFPVLMKTVFGASVLLTIESHPRKDGSVLHIYRITGEEAVTTIRHRFHIHEERRIDMRNLPTNSIGMFLGGVFLICGTMTEPTKDYHLEFSVPNAQLGKDLCDLLYSVGVHPGCIQRRCGYSVYLKVSEEIGDLLTFMGAQKCTLGLIDVQIDKEMKNRINRVNNCDMANIDKVISASERQCRDIRTIVAHDGMKELTEELRELAELRLENPHLSLSELSELLSKPIGRSGVNHRFQRLAGIAAAYRKGDACDE